MPQIPIVLVGKFYKLEGISSSQFPMAKATDLLFSIFDFLLVKATILKSLMRSGVIAHPGRPEQLKPVSSAVMLQIQPPSKSFIKEKNLKFQNPQVPTGIT